MSKIAEAERKVADIIRQLEIDTGDIVKSIGCEELEVTSIEDDRRRLKMRVVIETERPPGRDWL